MAKSLPKPVVRITPGKNEKVEARIKFEDLLAAMTENVAPAQRSRASIRAQDGELGKVRRLADELKRELQAMRAKAEPKTPPKAPRRKRAPKRKS